MKIDFANKEKEKFKNKQLQAACGYLAFGNAYMFIHSGDLPKYHFSTPYLENSIWRPHEEVIRSLGRYIVNMPKQQYPNELNFLYNFAYKHDSDRCRLFKAIEAPFRFAHNVVLLIPALLRYFEKWCLIVSYCAKTDDTTLGRINHVTKWIATGLYFLIRIAASTLWAVLDPINNIKAICNNPTLGKPAKVILSLMSAAISISAYVFAPYLLFKFAPALMATIVKPLVLLAHYKPIATIATFFKPIATTVAKATTFLAPPKAIALSALYLVSGMCSSAWAFMQYSCCGCARKTSGSSLDNVSVFSENTNYSDDSVGSVGSDDSDDSYYTLHKESNRSNS